MSIRADILQAKWEYEQHLSEHKCSTLQPCQTRATFWNAWMGTAEMWGREPDDRRRQREHHFRNVKNAPPTTEAEAAA